MSSPISVSRMTEMGFGLWGVLVQEVMATKASASTMRLAPVRRIKVTSETGNMVEQSQKQPWCQGGQIIP